MSEQEMKARWEIPIGLRWIVIVSCMRQCAERRPKSTSEIATAMFSRGLSLNARHLRTSLKSLCETGLVAYAVRTVKKKDEDGTFGLDVWRLTKEGREFILLLRAALEEEPKITPSVWLRFDVLFPEKKGNANLSAVSFNAQRLMVLSILASAGREGEVHPLSLVRNAMAWICSAKVIPSLQKSIIYPQQCEGLLEYDDGDRGIEIALTEEGSEYLKFARSMLQSPPSPLPQPPPCWSTWESLRGHFNAMPEMGRLSEQIARPEKAPKPKRERRERAVRPAKEKSAASERLAPKPRIDQLALSFFSRSILRPFLVLRGAGNGGVTVHDFWKRVYPQDRHARELESVRVLFATLGKEELVSVNGDVATVTENGKGEVLRIQRILADQLTIASSDARMWTGSIRDGGIRLSLVSILSHFPEGLRREQLVAALSQVLGFEVSAAEVESRLTFMAQQSWVRNGSGTYVVFRTGEALLQEMRTIFADGGHGQQEHQLLALDDIRSFVVPLACPNPVAQSPSLGQSEFGAGNSEEGPNEDGGETLTERFRNVPNAELSRRFAALFE